MLLLSEIPPRVLKALTEGHGFTLDQIKEMEPKEAFNAFCQWEGLLGWSETLWDAVEGLKAAETYAQVLNHSCQECSGDGWNYNFHGDGSVNKRFKCRCQEGK